MTAAAVSIPASRFARLPRSGAIALLVLLALAIAAGFLSPPAPTHMKHVQGGDDLAFYQAVVARVHAGQPYEAAAVAQLRAVHGPLRPFLAVRPPALAWILAALPSPSWGDWILEALSLTVIAAWVARLRGLGWGPASLGGAAIGLFTGLAAPLATRDMGLIHDAWGGVLIALSLAARSERRFWTAAALGLAAALIRELALPYLVVMAMAALVERRRSEAGAFAGAFGLALIALAWHAHAVDALVGPADPASPGWVKFGGWSFVLATAKWNLLAILGGLAAAAAVVPLSLVGAAGRGDGLGLRLAALLFGYTIGFMVIGRPENTYWGLVTAPLTAVGLCLAPAALRDLVRRVAA
jgi:hypothetical protein